MPRERYLDHLLIPVMSSRGEKLLELIRYGCLVSYHSLAGAWLLWCSLGTYPCTTPGSTSSPDAFLRDQVWLPAGRQAFTSGSRIRLRGQQRDPSCGLGQHTWGAWDFVPGKSRQSWQSKASEYAALRDRLSSSCTNLCCRVSSGDIIRLTKEPCCRSLLRGCSSFD